MTTYFLLSINTRVVRVKGSVCWIKSYSLMHFVYPSLISDLLPSPVLSLYGPLGLHSQRTQPNQPTILISWHLWGPFLLQHLHKVAPRWFLKQNKTACTYIYFVCTGIMKFQHMLCNIQDLWMCLCVTRFPWVRMTSVTGVILWTCFWVDVAPWATEVVLCPI